MEVLRSRCAPSPGSRFCLSESVKNLMRLKPFYPDRAASRILGMGDMLSLIEKAEKVYDQKQAEALEKKLRKNQFTLEDFQDQLRMVKKIGSMTDLGSNASWREKAHARSRYGCGGERVETYRSDHQFDDKRRTPKTGNPQWRSSKRIATGSGTSVADVNRFLKQYLDAKKMMRKLPNWD